MVGAFVKRADYVLNRLRLDKV